MTKPEMFPTCKHPFPEALAPSVNRMRGDMNQMRTEMNVLLFLNQTMHDIILELRTAVHHNRSNPIVVEDDKTDVEELVLDTAPRPVRIWEEDLLREIVEETPPRGVVDDRDSSPEV